MSLTPEPDARRAEFEDLVAKLKAHDAAGSGSKLGIEKPVEDTPELQARMREEVAKLRAKLDEADRRKILRPIAEILATIPPEVNHLVNLASDLDVATRFKAENDSNAALVAYDTARGNFSIGLRRELRDPDLFAKALVALHLIRQEVNRERPA